MNLGMANKPIKQYLVILFIQALMFGLAYLIYVLFQDNAPEVAPWMAATLLLFLECLFFILFAVLLKNWIGFGLSYMFHKKTGIVAFLLNSSRQLYPYVGPYNYKFFFKTKDDKVPPLDLELGSNRVSWGNIPVHFGLDSSWVDIDVVNVAHQQIVNTVLDAPKFSQELELALKKSMNPLAKKLFEDNQEGKAIRERMLSIDLNQLFPMTTLRVDHAGICQAEHMAGKRIALIQSLAKFFGQPIIALPIMLVVVGVLASAVFGYQCMENTGKMGPLLDSINENIGKIGGVVNKFIQAASVAPANNALQPTPLEGG